MLPDIPEPLSREALLERGSCCGSGCCNCPYEPRHQEGTTLVYDPSARDALWEGWPGPRNKEER